MILTITTTHHPATDLGYLLHKHPDRWQSFEIACGSAHVLYPEATEERTTAALMLDVDPITLVRGRPGSGQGDGGSGNSLLTQYVNDRPYVASSFLSVALNRVFGSALAGRCTTRPELVETPIPLEATFGPVRASGGAEMVQRLFEPLGYAVTTESGSSSDGKSTAEPWFVTLAGTQQLDRLLSHIYVLLPVLDNQKHYWVSHDELEKLFRHGADWLPTHPEREMIASRYLKHGRRLTRQAIERFAELDDVATSDQIEDQDPAAQEPALPAPVARLHDQRLQAVAEVIRESGARRVLDLGCGEGKLLKLLLKSPSYDQIVGVDVSIMALARAKERLELEHLSQRQRDRVQLFQSALTYRDRRLTGFDAAAVVEVVEHFEPDRLESFERALFHYAKPGLVVLTTPNRDYNAAYPALSDGSLRNVDHRFEWTRSEFESWARRIADRYDYSVELTGIGDADERYGQPTQMAVFRCM